MKLLNENIIEQLCIEKMQVLGWQYTHGKTIIAEGENPWRSRSSEVVLRPILAEAVARLNPELPESAVENVVNLVCRADVGNLIERNKTAYQWLRNGVPVSYRVNGEEKHHNAFLIDFFEPSNNHFDVVNQFTIKGNKGNRRPDVIGFVNGLPLLVFELKNPLAQNVTIIDAFDQLQTYKDELPELFVFNQGLIISDGSTARLGSLSADFDRFAPWRVVDEKNHSQRIEFETEMVALINGLFSPTTLLNYVQNFVVFEQTGKGLIKKIAAYHQFYGVNEAVDCTLVAASETGNRKIGVMWHTQGSGKSLSMLFYTGKVLSLPELKNPTIVVVTDRNDLDGQLFQTFSAGRDLIRQEPVQADGRDNLRDELAKRQSGGVIFTTIQKFGLLEGELKHPILNDRQNIIVISDEAHRSQYGFSAEINEKGEMRVGYAKHLRNALPNASFIGFTGTPISQEDKDTQDVFGRYVSVYDMQDAVKDGATVPLFYQAMHIKLDESDEFSNVVQEAEAVYHSANENDQNIQFKLLERVRGSEARLTKLAENFVNHYEQRAKSVESKAMFVALTREIAVKLYQKITALRPEWHSDDINQGTIKVMMTGSAKDRPPLSDFVPSAMDRKTLEKRFKDPDDSLRIVIVVDMWLTGFDVPCCNTLYIDKPMKEHNLMQAIARVNRVFRNKNAENGGLIVDYVGLLDELEEAKKQYSRSGGKGEMTADISTVVNKVREHLDVIRGMFATPINGEKFTLSKVKFDQPEALLQAIELGANHILGLDFTETAKAMFDEKDPTPRKDKFLWSVQMAKKGYALSGAEPEIKSLEAELAFYDAVRQKILKASSTDPSKTSSREKTLQLELLLNRAVTSDGVLDLFGDLGEEQPNLSLLTDEFLTAARKNPSHLMVSSIEKYLKKQFKEKAGSNLSVQKDFETKLKEAMNRYHNQSLTVADIIHALIEMAKALDAELQRGKELGLSKEELAFYDALIRNESAVREMQDTTLIELAKVITEQLRKSATVDWEQKESVRARMRFTLKILLRKYKYPPDCQEEAVELVIKQAEVLAEELVSSQEKNS